MRLKKILVEQNIDKAAKKLLEELDTGNWIVKSPLLFRGTDRADDLLAKKETDWRESTKDTDPTVDQIIQLVYENCYSEYPKRKKGVFASTDMDFITRFGKDIVVVFPHNNAKVSSLYQDPFEQFMSVGNKMRKLSNFASQHPDHREQLSPFLQKIVDTILEIYGDVIDFKSVDTFPCPDKIMEKIESDIERHIKEDMPNKLHRPLKKFWGGIKWYFDKTEPGYPDGQSKEVIVEGRYLRVDWSVVQEADLDDLKL